MKDAEGVRGTICAKDIEGWIVNFLPLRFLLGLGTPFLLMKGNKLDEGVIVRAKDG